MIFYNNVQVDSGSDTYSKGKFPTLKAYIGPVLGTYGEDIVNGYVAYNNFDSTQLKLCCGYGFNPGYCIPAGMLSIESINSHSGWYCDGVIGFSEVKAYSIIDKVIGNFETELIMSGGLLKFSLIDRDTLITEELIMSGGLLKFSLIDRDTLITEELIVSSSN
jgi:hypothetical protein